MDEIIVTKQQQLRKRMIFFMLCLIIAGLIMSNFKLAVVRGESMEPTLHDGEIVLVTKAYWLFGKPVADDIVILRHEGEYLIKRIGFFETLPNHEEAVFIVGDNRLVSEDSRVFGLIPSSEIVGKMIFTPKKSADVAFFPNIYKKSQM